MPPDPQMLDGVRVERSERISVYAYRWSPLTRHRHRLRARSTGCWTSFDAALIWCLSTDSTIPRCASASWPRSMRGFLSPNLPSEAPSPHRAPPRPARRNAPPTMLVQNHTRDVQVGGGVAGCCWDAGIETPPDVVVPFEPSLPEIGDRGWPKNRVPRSLRKPLARLADRVLTAAAAGRPVPPGILAGGLIVPARAFGRRSRPAALLAGLRVLASLPNLRRWRRRSRTAAPRPFFPGGCRGRRRSSPGSIPTSSGRWT